MKASEKILKFNGIPYKSLNDIKYIIKEYYSKKELQELKDNEHYISYHKGSYGVLKYIVKIGANNGVYFQRI